MSSAQYTHGRVFKGKVLTGLIIMMFNFRSIIQPYVKLNLISITLNHIPENYGLDKASILILSTQELGIKVIHAV